MADIDWDELQVLFERALAIPAHQREQFLIEACAGKEELRAELDRLLDADARNANTSGESGILGSVQDIDAALIGSELDSWRVIERIGVGGMGSVFRAERTTTDFEQQAALKVVKKGMDTESVLQRFRQERRILARLNHPNIARLLDGGVTGDGRPYFAMELVRGIPITDYCDQHRLGLNDRLRLFQKACDAVHSAHRSLIVHRDLKPSNIIVTEDGELKLLDFGIAKLLDDSEDDGLTRTGMQLHTPAYAAPEQLTDSAITTATDVYALGIVLYELLSGRRPFEVRRTPSELRELVLTGELMKPSTAISHSPAKTGGAAQTQTLDEISALRGERADRLRRSLAGDLDTICLMAMRREPEQRYASADEMAADIGRHLRGLPVIATPDSLGYRLGKFYRRNRPVVLTSAIGALGFLGMTAYYTQQLAVERDVAVLEQQKSAEIVDFVTGLFEVADPSESRGEDITARQLLDAGAERIQNELGDRPAVQSTMQRVLGEVYYQLGLPEVAEGLISTSLEQQIGLNGDRTADVANTKITLAKIFQDRGDLEEAETLYNDGLDILRQTYGNEHQEVFAALSAIAFFEETRGDYELAEQMFSEALAMARRVFPGDDPMLAEALKNTAGILRIQDRSAEAEPLLLESLAMLNRLHGDEPHPATDDVKRQLAGLYRDVRRFDESKPLYLEIIESRTRMLGPDHREVAHTWNSYSQLLSDMGENEAAIDANLQFVEIMERSYDGPHPSLGAAYHNRGIFLDRLGRSDEALEYFDRSLDMLDQTDVPPRHPNRAYPIAAKAGVHLNNNNYVEAEALLRDALSLRLENFDPQHLLVTEVRNSLGAALTGQARYAEAEPLLTETYQLFLDGRGPEDPRTIRGTRRLIAYYEALGDQDAAERYRAQLPANAAEP